MIDSLLVLLSTAMKIDRCGDQICIESKYAKLSWRVVVYENNTKS